jgi:hypothetical protein
MLLNTGTDKIKERHALPGYVPRSTNSKVARLALQYLAHQSHPGLFSRRSKNFPYYRAA